VEVKGTSQRNRTIDYLLIEQLEQNPSPLKNMAFKSFSGGKDAKKSKKQNFKPSKKGKPRRK